MTLDKIIQGLKAVRTIHNGNYSTQIDSAIHILKHLKTELEPCEDCVSREAVEAITWEEPSYTDALNALTEVREKVRALPSVKPKAEWIPCSERLPASDEDVLVTNGRGVYIGWIDNADMICFSLSMLSLYD